MSRFRAAILVMANCVKQMWLMTDHSRYLNKFRLLMKIPIRNVKVVKGRNVTAEIPDKWLRAQEDIKRKVIRTDTEEWQKTRLISEYENIEVDKYEKELKFVAGVDISYSKEDKTACAALVVCQVPHMSVVYEYFQMKKVTFPYVSGYLSFREVMPYLEAVRHLLLEAPQFKPQVILVDGNGLLHSKSAGLACHLGVLSNIPTVGVSKNICKFKGLNQMTKYDLKCREIPLLTRDGKVLGMAITTGNSKRPIFVSIGHRISLETAVWVVKFCSKYRIPEPIRQADLRSRKLLNKFPQLKTPST